MTAQFINPKLVNYASILEDNTRDQAIESSSMDFIYPHLALMPDAHLGMGATVGSVIPTLGAIIPAAVGVDIGCGMMAVRTKFTAEDMAIDLRPLHAAISAAVPLSAGKYNSRLSESAKIRIQMLNDMPGVDQAHLIAPNWTMQLGSLGSGNHFIEVSLDEEDQVWLFLHSGSRGVGNKLAMKHIKIAQNYCTDAGINLPNRDLAYLEEGTSQFDEYIEALRWAQNFAFLNRAEMMDRVIAHFADFLDVDVLEVTPTDPADVINCHHNYTMQETHYGRSVWLSRKGAIDAHAGVPGLIPGSMGAASYVVVGKGNAEALNSSPHGAGRNFSRGEAKRRFTRDDLDDRMKGIVWGESDAFLDEHPDAYKSIDIVMEDAEDLVEIKHTLHQIVNVKGD